MPDKDPVVTGARIAKRRHQAGMTQVELAEALGVSPSTVANWERGASYPKRKLGKVEQLLGPLDDDEPRPSAGAAEALDRMEAELSELRRLLRRDPGKGDEGDDGRARYAV